MSSLLWFPALGVVAGLLAGMLGIGGGIVVVPVLMLVFHWLGFEDEALTHLAVGTSLATIVLTSLSAIAEHHRKRAVDWPLVRRLTPSLVGGAMLGALIADALSGPALRVSFGVFSLLMAAQMAAGRRKTAPAAPRAPSFRDDRLGLALASGTIGTASSVLGIGGGSLTVPWLSWRGVAMPQAVATSAACGFPIALAGAVGFAVTGLDATGRPALSVGYVYLPALIGIITTSIPVAVLGARWTHRIPAATLKRLFALLLAIVGCQFIFGLR